MTPSTVPTPDTVQSRHSGLNAGCARRRSGRRPRLRQHPPGLTPADARSPPARPLFRPNRVHFRLGPVFCLGQLPTPHRCDAVGLGYTVVARFNCTQTFTGWFHGFISARSAAVSAAFGCTWEDVSASQPHRTHSMSATIAPTTLPVILSCEEQHFHPDRWPAKDSSARHAVQSKAARVPAIHSAAATFRAFGPNP